MLPPWGRTQLKGYKKVMPNDMHIVTPLLKEFYNYNHVEIFFKKVVIYFPFQKEGKGKTKPTMEIRIYS